MLNKVIKFTRENLILGYPEFDEIAQMNAICNQLILMMTRVGYNMFM